MKVVIQVQGTVRKLCQYIQVQRDLHGQVEQSEGQIGEWEDLVVVVEFLLVHLRESKCERKGVVGYEW